MIVNQNIVGMPSWDKTAATILAVVSEKDSWNRNELKKKSSR